MVREDWERGEENGDAVKRGKRENVARNAKGEKI